MEWFRPPKKCTVSSNRVLPFGYIYIYIYWFPSRLIVYICLNGWYIYYLILNTCPKSFPNIQHAGPLVQVLLPFPTLQLSTAKYYVSGNLFHAIFAKRISFGVPEMAWQFNSESTYKGMKRVWKLPSSKKNLWKLIQLKSKKMADIYPCHGNP